MGYRYFHRGQWRPVSAAKARVLRRRGIEVIDTVLTDTGHGAQGEPATSVGASVVAAPHGRETPASVVLPLGGSPQDFDLSDEDKRAHVESALAELTELTDDELDRLTRPEE